MTKMTFAELATGIHEIRCDRRARHRRPAKATAMAKLFEDSGWSRAEYTSELETRTARILANTRSETLLTNSLRPDYNAFLQLLVEDDSALRS